jgi:hypothetical protein
MKERISERVSVELPVQVSLRSDAKFFLKAMIINISTHGFCFRADAKYTDAFLAKPVAHLSVAITKKETAEFDVQIIWAGRTSPLNCLVGGEIMDPSGLDYQKILEVYKRIMQYQSERVE